MAGEISLVVCAQRASPAARVPRVLKVDKIKFNKSKVWFTSRNNKRNMWSFQPRPSEHSTSLIRLSLLIHVIYDFD
jgi:hypothetical protein